MPIKTFSGMIASGGEVELRLGTSNGLTGYKIKKFEVIGVDGNQVYENVTMMYRTKQGTPPTQIKFNDSQLIGACLYQDSSTNGILNSFHVVFDNVTLNQDIFIYHYESASSTAGMNYYIELEQVKLSTDEAAVATLKDMRGSN